MIKDSEICNYIKLIKRYNKQKEYKKRVKDLRTKNLSQPTFLNNYNQYDMFPSSFCDTSPKKTPKVNQFIKPIISEMQLKINPSNLKKKNLYSQYCEDLEKKISTKDHQTRNSGIFIKFFKSPSKMRNSRDDIISSLKGRKSSKDKIKSMKIQSERINMCSVTRSDFSKKQENQEKYFSNKFKGFIFSSNDGVKSSQLFSLTPKQKSRITTEGFNRVWQTRMKKRSTSRLNKMKAENKYKQSIQMNIGKIQGWIQEKNQVQEEFSKIEDVDFL